jgi:hypothetical protein
MSWDAGETGGINHAMENAKKAHSQPILENMRSKKFRQGEEKQTVASE